MSEVTRTPGAGGPAFAPHCGSGVTIRDYFAAAALTGILAMCAGRHINGGDDELMAEQAYDLADAMMAARREQ